MLRRAEDTTIEELKNSAAGGGCMGADDMPAGRFTKCTTVHTCPLICQWGGCDQWAAPLPACPFDVNSVDCII